MIAPVFILGFVVVLAVAAIGVSLFAVWRSQALAQLADQMAHARVEELRQTLVHLQQKLDRQGAQLVSLEHQPVTSALSGVPKAGLNLSKRTQVLRMHRNGDATDRISAALEVPQQEVDLLIKVHRIVLSSR